MGSTGSSAASPPPESAPEASARGGSSPRPRVAPGGHAGSGGIPSSSTESVKNHLMLFLLQSFRSAAVLWSFTHENKTHEGEKKKKKNKREKKKKKKKKS